MTNTQIIETCRHIIIQYLEDCQGYSDRNTNEIVAVEIDDEYLKFHLKGMISLLESGVEIIEKRGKDEKAEINN